MPWAPEAAGKVSSCKEHMKTGFGTVWRIDHGHIGYINLFKVECETRPYNLY